MADEDRERIGQPSAGPTSVRRAWARNTERVVERFGALARRMGITVWRHPGLRFGILFLLLAASFSLFDVFVVSRMTWVSRFTAHIVAWMSPAIGLQATVLTGGTVWFRNGSGDAFAYQVTQGCTATMPTFLYMAAVLAYPASWGHRGLGLAAGVPALFGLNVVRLVSMAWLGLHAPSLFDEAHVGWWQAGFIIGVGLAWWVWVQMVEGRATGERLRKVLQNAGLHLGIFAVAFAALWYVGSLGSVRSWYGLVVWRSSRFWAQAMGLPYATLGNVDPLFFHYNGGLALGWVLASSALFVSRPKERWLRRLVGFAVGAVVAHVGQMGAAIVRWHSGLTVSPWAEPMILTLQLVLIGMAWAFWTRRFLWRRREAEPAPDASASTTDEGVRDPSPTPLGLRRASGGVENVSNDGE